MNVGFLGWPATWGFFGAFIYAATVYATTVWGDMPLSNNRRKRALAELIIGVIVGPVMAEGFGPSLLHVQLLHALDVRGVSLGIGITANYLWPRLVRILGSWVIRRIEGNETP